MPEPLTCMSGATAALERLNGRLFATVPEAAAILRYDERTIRKAAASGEIPCSRTGRSYRIPVMWIRHQIGAH